MGLPKELTFHISVFGWHSETVGAWLAYTFGLVAVNCLQLYCDNTLDQQQRIALSRRVSRGRRALAVGGLTFLYDFIDVLETYFIANGNLWSVLVMLAVEFLYVSAMYAEIPCLRWAGSLKRDMDTLTADEKGDLLDEQCSEVLHAVRAMSDAQKNELAAQLFPVAKGRQARHRHPLRLSTESVPTNAGADI